MDAAQDVPLVGVAEAPQLTASEVRVQGYCLQGPQRALPGAEGGASIPAGYFALSKLCMKEVEKGYSRRALAALPLRSRLRCRLGGIPHMPRQPHGRIEGGQS